MNSTMRTRFALWFRSLLGRRRLESEMEEEIRFHLEARAAALREQGVPGVEAKRQARVEFGGVETYKEDMRSAFGLRRWDELSSDVRYALRLFQRSPGFVAIAVISLALAIGANTTIFSLANEMLYKRLGIPRVEELRLLSLEGQTPTPGRSEWGGSWVANGVETSNEFTYAAYRRLQAENRTLGPIVAFKDLWHGNITANGNAQAGDAQLVSGGFYQAMELQPQLGRPILPSDDRAPGTGAVTLISDEFWHRAFGGSPSVLGKPISVNGAVVTIIGVNPKGFTGAQAAQISPEVFLPLSMMPLVGPPLGGSKGPFDNENFWWLNLMARALPGVAPELAAANMNAVFRATMLSTLKVQPGEHLWRVVVADGSRGLDYSGRQMAKPLHVLLALSGMVLLLASANIANLMLARATAREREMSVRLALGASKARVLRQVITESLLLSGAGGVLGVLLAYLARNVLPNLLQQEWQGTPVHVAFDWWVLLFTSAVTVATGLLFGLLPAWRSARSELNTALKDAGRSASRRRRAWTGKLIVAFQVALSTLLVAASGLFLRTLINLNHVQPGFRTEGLLEFDLGLSAKRYPHRRSLTVMEGLEEQLRGIPGVQEVAFANPPLLAQSNWTNDFDVEGAPKKKLDGMDGDEQYPFLSNVGEDFLPMMGIRILRGRNFGSQDTATSPRVSIINQAVARRFFPNSDPLGRRFRMSGGPDGRTKIFYTIVGVCADTLYSEVRRPVSPLHFELYRQNDDALNGTMILRTDLPAQQLLPSLRRVVQRVDPDLPLMNVRTQQQQIDADLQNERMFASLTAGFGAMALLLACIGIYGVMAYTVMQRTNEIGVRLALGAPRLRVRAMVLREAAWLAGAGVVVGLAVVLALVQVVKGLLYGLQPRDPVSLAATGVLLLTVALVAGWIPAARASRVEPIEALRHE